MSRVHFELRRSPTWLENECQVAVVPGYFWHLPLIYSQIYSGAWAGHFSYWLIEEKKQFPMLVSMLGVALFGYIKLPGAAPKPALLRVVETRNVAVGHTFLIKHHDHMEVATCVVKDEYRRHGIGKILIDDAIELAGNLPVIASCMPKSHAMSMLFKKRGFVEIKQFSLTQTGHAGLRHWQYSSNCRHLTS